MQTKPLWFHCRFHGTGVGGKVGTKFRAQSVRRSEKWKSRGGKEPGMDLGDAAVSPAAFWRSPFPGPWPQDGLGTCK